MLQSCLGLNDAHSDMYFNIHLMTAHKTSNERLGLTRDFMSRPLRKPCSREPGGTHLPDAYPEAEVVRETRTAMDRIEPTDFNGYSRSILMSAHKTRYCSPLV